MTGHDMDALIRRAAGVPLDTDDDNEAQQLLADAVKRTDDPDLYPQDWDDWQQDPSPDHDQGQSTPDPEPTPSERINDRIRTAVGIEVHRDRRGQRIPDIGDQP